MEFPSSVFWPQLDNNGNTTFISSPKSPTSKKNSQQKFAQWPPIRQMSHLVSLKSKIGVEYRRYAIIRDHIAKFEDFFKRVESIHQLQGSQFVIYYSDQDGELLPINNDNNLAKAIDATTRLKTNHYIVPSNNNTHNFPPYQYHYQPQQVILERPFLKLFLEKKGIPNDLYYLPNTKRKDSRPKISSPEDFRQVSSIIDADKLPATRRRVVLKRGDTDKLGFYIMDGTYQRMNSHGRIERHYGIFISRLEPGCLAESTNLLAENDEILEVNGIPVDQSKTLEQVKEMMVANSSNLIITTRPAKPYSQYPANYYNRMRYRNMNNPIGRDRLPSTQSTGSDLGEDFIRHHMN